MGAAKGRQGTDWVSRLGVSSRLPWSMIDMLTASFFINILSLAMPLTLLQVYDRILPNAGLSTLALLILGVFIALLLEMVLRVARSHISGWIGARFEHLAGCSAMERLMQAHLSKFETTGTGVHLERLNALQMLKEFYAGQAMLTLFDLPFAILYLGIVGYLGGNLVYVPIVIVSLFAISAMVLGTKLKDALAARMMADDRRFDFIIEVLGGVHTVKGLAMETQMLRRYERLQETCAEADYNVTLHSSNAIGLGTLFSQLTMFAVVGFGSTFVIDGMLTIGGLAACTMLSGRAMQPLQRAVGIWTRFQSIRLARDRVRQLFDLDVEQKPGLPKLKSCKGDLVLNDVHFRYKDDGPDILAGVNMHIRPGETVGVTGDNASGKSTLLFTMMGALRPTKGTYSIDGHDINDIDVTSLSDDIAYLPQQGVLFNGTVMENLTMFRPELAEKAVEISRLLGLDRVVAHMPMGFETKVGDGASDAIPRGIKQRIAIARSLMSRPRVLLFDEANSAMDSVGDAELRELLMQLKGQVTLVMIAVRPSMLKICDSIYDLKEGKVYKRGDDGGPNLGGDNAKVIEGSKPLQEAPTA